jgi:hypothetical protein
MILIKTFKSVLFICMAMVFLSFNLPAGWFISGDQADSYEMGIDKGAGMNGKNAVTIKSINKTINGFGTLMQNSMPDKYLGKKIKMSGYMKSKDVAEKAAFWLRIGQPDSDSPFSFDNMEDRPIKGTTDWKKYDLIVDVPSKATNISYGAMLSGTGQIWFANLSFEIVDTSVPATGRGNEHYLPHAEPTNLDFEK